MLFMDLLIAYAPSPVKPLLFAARRFPLALSLGLAALGLVVAARAGSVANVVHTALAASHKQSALGPDDVSAIGWAVATLGALYPAFVGYRAARRVYVLTAYRSTCRDIRAALDATVFKSGGLVAAAVRFRGVVIDTFDTANAVVQIEQERVEVSVTTLRAEYRRLSHSIDAVVRLSTEAVRATRQGHMHRLVLDVLHGGVLYQQVVGTTYLMGCVVEQGAMESAGGEWPRAYREMHELSDALRLILGRDGGKYAD